MKKVLVGAFVILLFAVVAMSLKNKPAVAPSPTTTASPTNALEPNYTDPDFGYRIHIPDEMTVEKQSKYSTLFYPQAEPQGQGPTNFMYISVVTPEMRENNGEIYNYSPDHFQKLIALDEIGDSVNLAESDVVELGEWFTYKVVDEVDIDNGRVKIFENNKPWEFPSGTTEKRFIYGTESNIYILGYYTGGDTGATLDPREAYNSILSFKVK